MLSAVAYCHVQNICHRDLKPENIMLERTKGKIKIIDFGTAMSFNPAVGMTTILGTPYYMAPEIFNSNRYDEKSDMWSVGVIMFVMLTGRPPFYGNTD
jgi:serine/threonine protein kinase